MHIAILSFDGYNEPDSLVALGILNRAGGGKWRVSIASPTSTVTAMSHEAIMNALQLDPLRQLIGAQCSGVLVLAKLGLSNIRP